MIVLAALLLLLAAARAQLVGPYKLTLVEHPKAPALSLANPKGQGYSPCNFTFNPAWIPASDIFPGNAILVRAANCPKEFGGSNDHIMYTTCYSNGTCDDLVLANYTLENGSEDPRVIYIPSERVYLNFYYAPGPNQSTVYLSKTQTPQIAKSWVHVTTLPWHRNGCVILRQQPPHYVLYGEGPDPLPGIGLAITNDFVNFTTVNASFLLPLGPAYQEIKLEAGTHAVTLATGDYLHFYAAATNDWNPPLKGNYTAGWIILDKDDPSHIIQRSAEHILIPTMPYEQGLAPYPMNRRNVVFLCSAVPTEDPTVFRVWYGAADASVGSALIKVDYTPMLDSRRR